MNTITNKQRVEIGAALLDELCETKNWSLDINLDNLNMVDIDFCVVGQLRQKNWDIPKRLAYFGELDFCDEDALWEAEILARRPTPKTFRVLVTAPDALTVRTILQDPNAIYGIEEVA